MLSLTSVFAAVLTSVRSLPQCRFVRALFVLVVCSLSSINFCHAQERIAFEKVLYRHDSANYTLSGVLPGDYIRVEADFHQSVVPNRHNCHLTATLDGHTIQVGYGFPYTNKVEFFCGLSSPVIHCVHNCDYLAGASTWSHIKVIVGRPDIVVNSLTLDNQTLTCHYQIGAIPWDPRGQSHGISLYFSKSDRVADIEGNSIASAGIDSGLNFRNAQRTVAFPCKNLPLAPWRCRNIIAVFDHDGQTPEIPEITKDNNSAAITWAIVEQVPQIQDKLNFPLAADLQRMWLTGDVASVFRSPGEKPVFSQNLPLAEPVHGKEGKLGYFTAITLEWALANASDPRVQETVSAVISKVTTSEAIKRLADRLKPDLPEGKPIHFGDLSQSGMKLYLQCTCSEVVPRNWGRHIHFDYVQHLLGRFGVYAVPCGTALRRHGKINFHIESVGVFIGDLFEFTGEDLLGFWSMDPPAASWYPSPGYTSIGNYTYRNYRDRIGRGRDIVIMSPAMAWPLEWYGNN